MAESNTDAETVPAGDMVYENAVLMLRDGLIMREFTDAIKCGDSGRIIISLKTLALYYRGSGRTKYAYEILVLIHNLNHVWLKCLRDVVIKNWLVNPMDHTEGFVPVDLLQEHMNLWIKTIYQAQGSNTLWEWLEMISPCINILWTLATQVNSTLGDKQGVKHHELDLSNDIRELMKVLHTHQVYSQVIGRTIDGEKGSVPDLLVGGLHGLKKPLEEYNELFEQLRT
ncbi:hypothetical protein EW026_g6675 [Hermanssonia centrifuga]|uniref:DUF6589 domain-containing protein n=1 Tax=Hermanssonia centrifuga TaxID=98765 RepID=A0A4S4KEM0_9APHY|nr:hypothetical protein EW026_g6675 [Hermanssonia centrifuga]